MKKPMRRRASSRRQARSDELDGAVRAEMIPLVEEHARRVRDYFLLHPFEEGADSVLRWWKKHEQAETVTASIQGA